MALEKSSFILPPLSCGSVGSALGFFFVQNAHAVCYSPRPRTFIGFLKSTPIAFSSGRARGVWGCHLCFGFRVSVLGFPFAPARTLHLEHGGVVMAKQIEYRFCHGFCA